MRKAVLLLVLSALFLPLSASSQPVIIVDSLNRSLCGNLFPWGETVQYVSIYNPDTNLQRLEFAIRMHSPDGATISIDPETAITLYNGFENAFSPLPVQVSLTQDGDDWVLTVRSAYYPGIDPDVGLPASSDTVTYIGVSFDAYWYSDLHICFDSTDGPILSAWLAAPGPALVFGGEVCWQVDGIQGYCQTLLHSNADELFTPSYCKPISHYIEAERYCAGPPLLVSVVQGPGEAKITSDPFGGDAVIYNFQPSSADYGKTYEVTLQPYDDWCGDGSYLITGEAVSFSVNVGTGDALVGDLDGSGVVDISDLQQMIYIMFIEPQDPPDSRVCDTDCSGSFDITDVSMLVDNLFLTLAPLCSGC